jgi:hypothetical protein
MRSIALIATFAAMVASSAWAQSDWTEHVFADNHFQVLFPGDPAVSTTPYTAADGAKAMKTTYSVRQGTSLYQAAVIDLTQSGIDAATAIDQAVSGLRENNNVTFNQAARQNGTCGRYLTLKGKDGSTSTVSLFFRDKRLYQIQGTSLPSNADASSGYMILFTNSFSFDVTLPFRGACFEQPADFFTNRN